MRAEPEIASAGGIEAAGGMQAAEPGQWRDDLLQLMVESVTDYAILRLDPDGIIRSWNPGAERIKGYKAAEIVGQNFAVFYPTSAVVAGVPQHELRVAAKVGRFEDEGWRVRKDGTEFWANVVITALRDEQGSLVGFAKLTRDLTERKRAERELANAHTLLASVLESTTDAVIQVDRNWKIIYANRQAAVRLPEYRMDRELWDCYPELKGSTAWSMLCAAMENRTESHVEIHYPAYREWYKVSAYPNEKGRSLFFSDVSREKMLTQELEKAQIMREKRIESLSHLAGGLTHEISNPLAIMHGLASNLKVSALEGGTVLEADVVEACDRIVHTADRAMAILRGLQSFSREASRDPMAGASIYKIVQGCIDLQKSRFERNRIELRMVSRPGIPAISCREVQIGQIVTNLISNAFDSIRSRPGNDDSVVIGLSVMGEQICIEVADSGPGVPEELRAHVMEPFFTTKESMGGTGIGLSLSRGIAQDHGGELALCEAEGKTVFRLLLPVQSATRFGVLPVRHAASGRATLWA